MTVSTRSTGAAESTPAPGRLLVNDEGTSSLHYLDLRSPEKSWRHAGPGRDLQLIGRGLVLRSQPEGFVELDLATGAVAHAVTLPDSPGVVETARRLPNGNTVVAGNGPGGAFLWELDRRGQPRADRSRTFPGVEKVRLLRITAEDTFLFCSQTAGVNVIHEAAWETGARPLFVVPPTVPADSMVKAVRITPGLVVVSTGYAASLLGIDVPAQKVLWTIGGKTQEMMPDRTAGATARPLSPFFFSGFQTFANGDHLVCNWQGHSADMNGQGYQLLRYDSAGRLRWAFDQSAYPGLSSLNNVIVLDGLDINRLYDEPNGVLVPVT